VLLERGEEKLISAVERGVIPHSIATEIARPKEGEVQQALAQAYEERKIRFGCYQLRKGQALDEAGLFFDPEALSEAEQRTLEAFAAANRLRCMTTALFVEDVFFRRGYELRATIVGFNLPFDISRLALGWAPARGKMRGGFSFNCRKSGGGPVSRSSICRAAPPSSSSPARPNETITLATAGRAEGLPGVVHLSTSEQSRARC
jgi:hypothetical protein